MSAGFTPFDYSRLEATANRLISRFGRPMTLTRASRVPDAGKPWLTQQGDATAAPAQSFSVLGVRSQQDLDHRERETVKATSAVYFVGTEAALPETLDVDWVLLDEGVEHHVESLRPVKPGDTLLVYRLEVQA